MSDTRGESKTDTVLKEHVSLKNISLLYNIPPKLRGKLDSFLCFQYDEWRSLNPLSAVQFFFNSQRHIYIRPWCALNVCTLVARKVHGGRMYRSLAREKFQRRPNSKMSVEFTFVYKSLVPFGNDCSIQFSYWKLCCCNTQRAVEKIQASKINK